MPVRILIYDDNVALSTSLSSLLEDEEGFVVLAAMPNAETVDNDIEELQPDVILMDIDMPVVNGVEAVSRIRKISKTLPVIMLTVFDDNDNIFNAICAGASGYILKRFVTEEIISAIRDVMAGGAPMTGSVARKVLQMVPQAKTETDTEKLSSRETQILQFLVNGYSYKMIAAELFLSLDTVRFHIKKIYDKLHVHTATAAVSVAIRNRLV